MARPSPLTHGLTPLWGGQAEFRFHRRLVHLAPWTGRPSAGPSGGLAPCSFPCQGQAQHVRCRGTPHPLSPLRKGPESMTNGRKRLLIVGPARAGKDTACEYLARVTDLRFAGTTSRFLAKYVAAHLAGSVNLLNFSARLTFAIAAALCCRLSV